MAAYRANSLIALAYYPIPVMLNYLVYKRSFCSYIRTLKIKYISGCDRKRSQWRRYGFTMLAVAIAMLLKLLLHPLIDHENPFLVFFAAVLVSALYGGMEAGVLGTVLAALISNYLFLSPTYSFFNHNLGQNLQLGMFVLEGIAISSVVAALNSAKRQAELSRLKILHHQESLRQSEERFRLLVEGLRDYAIFMLDTDGRVASWNAGAERIFGYQEAEIIGQHFSCMFTPEDIHDRCPEQELRTAVAVGKADHEGWHTRSDGTSFWASGVVTALRDEAGNLRGFSKVVRDITERKRAESELRASEERLRLALEVAHMGTWDWNIMTNQVTWSHNYELLFGLTPGTFGGNYEAILSYVHPEDRQVVAEALTCCLQERVCYDCEFRIVRSDGSIRWMAGKNQVFYDETGTTAVRMVGTTMDITARKQAADQLKASLQEKEVLLKEIHHRVKNNMQIISSLLNLQSGHIEDEQTLKLLKESQNRVASMALVHEQLYQSKDLARIDFAEYIQILATNLFSAYDVSSDRIALKINIDDVQMSVDAAITCGLIVNELVCNSLKYAFSPSKKGEICIHLYSANNNNFTLNISDNGIGLPQNFDLHNTETLGLQLVTALTGQLEGTIELKRNMGTEFKITFQNKVR